MALSLGSPRAGVTRRLVAVEPGLSSTPEGTAIARPSDPGRYVRVGGRKVNASFVTPYPAALSTAISVARVRPSATPSQRVWTQWRWNALTISRVACSNRPEGAQS